MFASVWAYRSDGELIAHAFEAFLLPHNNVLWMIISFLIN